MRDVKYVDGKKEIKNFLILENKNGLGDLIDGKYLKRMINVCRANIQIVILSSCYSENEADIFIQAGVKHVICIKKDSEINDDACILFS